MSPRIERSVRHLTRGGVRWLVRADQPPLVVHGPPSPARAFGSAQGSDALDATQEILFNETGLRLSEWQQAGQAQIVKSGPHRTVYRVIVAHLDFHLKHYHPRNPTWIRNLVPSPARREFEHTEEVARRQVATLMPLALGESLAGGSDSFLITRTWDGATALSEYLQDMLPTLPRAEQTMVRQRLAKALGCYLARLHQAGVTHRDLHPGNLLLRLNAEKEPELILIDLHTASVSDTLEWPARRANLVILNRWFMLRATRTDRLRFWHAYHDERALSEGDGISRKVVAHRAQDLEGRTLASNLRFWWQHDARSRGTNRYFSRLRSRELTGHAVADLPLEALAPLLADPDAPFQSADVTVLKDSPTSSVVEFDLAGKRVIYKRFAVASWTAPWAAFLRLTPALRSFVLGHGLRLRCLPTPRPLAVWHRRRHGMLHEGYLLTEKVPDATDLVGHLDQLDQLSTPRRRARIRELIDQVAHLIRVLHGRHLSHRDLKAANLLVSTASWAVSAKGTRDLAAPGGGDLVDPGCVWFIDLVGVRRHIKLGRRRRIQNLTRLHASFHRHPGLTRTDKLRFLRVYLCWGLRGKGGWKRWWRQIEEATGAKVRRNLRNGRPLG